MKNFYDKYVLVVETLEKLFTINNQSPVSKAIIWDQVKDQFADHRDLNAILWQIWANHPIFDCDINFNTIVNPNKKQIDI
jgi:hypothetical protein